MTNIYNILNKTTVSAFIYKIMLIFLIASIIPSCKKAMDKEPLNSYSDAIVWQNPTLISNYVSSTYRGIPTGAFGGLPVYLACFTDEGKVIGVGIDATFNGGNITPSTIGGTPLDYWAAYYGVIGKCNIFLDRIQASTIDVALRTRMTGEIMVIRAYSYFSLISFYGGVPIINKPLTLADSLSLPRKSYDECMAFVITELDAAAAMLPSSYAATDQGRITKGAALAIKSRALLYAASPLNNSGNDLSKWQKAADAAKVVIDLGLYSLYSDYKNLFLRFAAYNSEIIWQRPFNNLVDWELDVEVALYPPGSNGRAQLSPIHNIVADYETLNGLLPINDPSYKPQNPYVNRDPRFDATILHDSSLFKGRRIQIFTGGVDADVVGSTTPRPGYYLRKFNDTTITNPVTKVNIGNTPWTFFRYAEILLNYAEAKYYLGDEVTCRTYINLVRSRPGVLMPNVTESGAALLTRLQHERRIELAFEGHRFFDVRRWKIANTVLNINAQAMSISQDPITRIRTYTISDMLPVRAFFPQNYLLPIAQSEINKDPNPLFVQNTGY